MIGQNLFEQNLPIDLHFYLAEGSEFDHQSAIFLWKLENIRYGDWGAGPNGDGSFIYSGQFKPSEVIYIFDLLSSHFLSAAGNIRSLLANFFCRHSSTTVPFSCTCSL